MILMNITEYKYNSTVTRYFQLNPAPRDTRLLRAVWNVPYGFQARQELVSSADRSDHRHKNSRRAQQLERVEPHRVQTATPGQIPELDCGAVD